MIFSRNRGNAGRRDPLRPGRHTRSRQGTDEVDLDLDVDLDFADADDAAESAYRDFGPYDLADVPDDGVERLDLGSLQIPALAGVEIRLQAGPQGDISGLALRHEASQLQLGAYAAPRTEGIWDEIRGLISQTLTSGGARPEEVEGDYGVEVRARIRDDSGATTIVRHLGIDGPRWFVHATFYGAAAADPTQAGPLQAVLRGLVVNRGTEARPVKETLPMKLPPEAQQQMAAAAASEAPPTAEVVEPAAVEPAAVKPAAAEPEVAKSDVAKSDVAKSDVAKSDVAKSDVAKSEVAQPAAPKSTPSRKPAAKSARRQGASRKKA